MIAPWVVEEMKTADFGDKRLDCRLSRILTQLGEHPTASIPAACGGNAEMSAAYRFFDNDKATVDTVLQSHMESTRVRMAAQKVVLLVQDTTEIDLTRPREQVVGAGPMDGSKRRGVFLHALHAFTPDGTPLGTVRAQVWARNENEEPKRRLPEAERRELLRRVGIEDKESYRWLEGFRQAGEEAQRMPDVQCVCIGDSESDIYEVLSEPCGEQPIDYIVRACQDRALIPDEPGQNVDLLRAEVFKAPVLFTHEVHVRGRDPKVNCEDRKRRQPRKPRQASCEVRAAEVTLRPPPRPDRKLPPVTIHAVLVSEIDPPADDVPVEWLLLTTLPVDSNAAVQQVIDYYYARWMIEILFRVLKGGCRVEDRRFEHLDRFLPCMATYMVVAWRTLYVCRMGRSCPDVNCEAIFEPAEWKAVYSVVRREGLPSTPPTLSEMVRMIGQLGGYVPRKGSEPGAQTIWLGLQRTYDMARCWRAFGPDADARAPRGATDG